MCPMDTVHTTEYHILVKLVPANRIRRFSKIRENLKEFSEA